MKKVIKLSIALVSLMVFTTCTDPHTSNKQLVVKNNTK